MNKVNVVDYVCKKNKSNQNMDNRQDKEKK